MTSDDDGYVPPTYGTAPTPGGPASVGDSTQIPYDPDPYLLPDGSPMPRPAAPPAAPAPHAADRSSLEPPSWQPPAPPSSSAAPTGPLPPPPPTSPFETPPPPTSAFETPPPSAYGLPHTATYGAPPKRSSAAAPILITLGVIALVVVGGILALVIALVSQLRGSTESSTDRDAVETTSSAPLPSGPLDARFGEGEYTVGVDLAAGFYRSDGVIDPDAYCFVDVQLADDEGYNSVYDGGHPVIELRDGDAVTSYDCGTFSLIDHEELFKVDDADLAQSMTSGMWLVGEDVLPGTYRPSAEVNDDTGWNWCFWSVDDNFRGDYSPRSRSGAATGGFPTVTLEHGDVFESSSCGTWQAIDEQVLAATDATRDTFPDGVWVAGVDIAPGEYVLTDQVADADESCGWSIYDSWRYEADWVDSAGAWSSRDDWLTFTVELGERVDTSGCGIWGPAP